jgi:hypothetical protein
MIAWLGLLMIVMTWLTGWYLLTRWRNADLISISSHAASSRSAALLFATVLMTCGTLLYWWLGYWLGPRLDLGPAYYVILIAAYCCQSVAALVPDKTGWRRSVHKWGAWTMAYLFLPLAWLVATAPSASSFARVLCVLLAAYMTVGVILVMARQIGARFLFFQASYIVALQLIILTAAYM